MEFETAEEAAEAINTLHLSEVHFSFPNTKLLIVWCIVSGWYAVCASQNSADKRRLLLLS